MVACLPIPLPHFPSLHKWRKLLPLMALKLPAPLPLPTAPSLLPLSLYKTASWPSPFPPAELSLIFDSKTSLLLSLSAAPTQEPARTVRAPARTVRDCAESRRAEPSPRRAHPSHPDCTLSVLTSAEPCPPLRLVGLTAPFAGPSAPFAGPSATVCHRCSSLG